MRKKVAKHIVGIALLIGASFSWLAFDQAGQEDRPRGFHDSLRERRGHAIRFRGAPEGDPRLPCSIIPNYTAVITGHTGTLGRAEVNLDLSEARADAVASALREAGIDPDRVTALGVGAAEPSERREDEGRISYQKRLSRATVSLRVR